MSMIDDESDDGAPALRVRSYVITQGRTRSSVDLPLDDRPLRVHVVGRTQGGRLLRRAVVSGLTREGWNDRWNRR